VLARLTLKNLVQRPLRYILTGLAIIFGVASVTAVFIFTDGLRNTFDELANNIESGFDVAVQSDAPFGDGTEAAVVPLDIAPVIASIDGVRAIQPRILDFGVVPIDGSDEPQLANGPNIGFNWEASTPTPRLFIRDGRPPEAADEFVADIDTFEAGDFTLGESYQVQAPGGSGDFTLVGTFLFGDPEVNGTVGAKIIAFEDATALELLNRGEGYDEITVIADDGVSPADLVARLEPVLAEQGETLVAVTREDLVEEAQGDFGQILGIFRTVLLVFAVIILLVSMFLIYNVFSITLGQRIKELGLLRAVGAFGSQVTNMMLGEALLLGVLATIVGIPAGWGLALLLRTALEQLGFPGDTGLPVNAPTIGYAIFVGVVVTVLAAIPAAARARSVSPLAALNEGADAISAEVDPRPAAAAGTLVIGLLLLIPTFLLDGWAPRLFLPLIGTLLVWIAVRWIFPRFAPFALLASGLGLLAVVATGDFGLGETFGLLGSGALVLILGASQVAPLFAAPVSRALGRAPTAILVGLVGLLLTIGYVGALAYLAFGFEPDVDSTLPDKFGLQILIQVLVASVVAAVFWKLSTLVSNRLLMRVLLFIAIVAAIPALPLILGIGLVRTIPAAFGTTGRVARENAARNPQRTATTATALMIGLTLVTAVTIIGDSIKSSVTNALDSSITADWLIQGPQAGPQGLPFSPEVAERVGALQEIDSVTSFRFSLQGFVSVQGDGLTADDVRNAIPLLFAAVGNDDNPNAIPELASDLGAESIDIDSVLAVDFDEVDRHIDPEYLQIDTSLVGPNAIYLEEAIAEDRGLAVGDTVLTIFLDGQVEELTVAAVYGDGFVFGERVVSIDLWNRHFTADSDQFVTAITAEDTRAVNARAAIEGVLSTDFPTITTKDKAEFAEQQEAQINQTLATVNVLLGLSALIAILGIAISLSLSVFERTREIGLIRAVGAIQQQVRHIIRWEGVIVAAFGGLLGVVLGIGLGVLATSKLPEVLVTTTSVPVGQLIVYIVVAAITGLVAGVFPALVAGRMNVLDAISSE
jgi:ABC-type antimicrobial peptide transport system permease subunit